MAKNQEPKENINPYEVEEDISDEAITVKHERPLLEERKKFQSYLKYPLTTRSRANRVDNESSNHSGANTPDPTSPAPAGDLEVSLI